MTRVAFVAFLLLTVARTGLAQQAPVSLRGRVVAAENEAALPRARIVVASGARPSEAVFTDDQGRFAIEIPPANASTSFTVNVAKAGFAVSAIAVSKADVYAGSELRIRLVRAAAISGRVVDPSGEPVVSALVVARPVTAAGAAGNRVPAPSLTETDDLGEYRLGGLPAGRYAIGVLGQPTSARDPLSRLNDRLQQSQNAAALLPEATSAVSTVDLRPADDVTGVTLLLETPGLSSDRCTPGTPSPSAAGTAAVRGRVLSTAGRPVSCATVRLTRPGQALRVVATDTQGRFAVDGLPAGLYTLEASKTGYVTLQYGQQRANQAGKTVTLREGETLERVDVALPGGSAVTGTVTDDYGEPVAGLTVRVLQLGTAGDLAMALSPMSVRPRQTDDRGRYRIFGLLPGRYLVTATFDAETSRPDAQSAGYAPVFYPGTADVAGAVQLPIEIGRHVTGIDLVFVRSKTARVSGFAYDATGQPLRTGLLLSRSQRSGGIMLEPRRASVGAGGEFAFANVPPGDYVIQAIAPAESQPQEPRAGPGTQAVHFGMQYVTVTDVDPAPVTVRTSAGSTVEGRIVAEGGDASRAKRLTVWPLPTDFDQSPVIGSGPAGFSLLDEGRFRVVGVTGPRRFVLTGAPEGWYLKSAVVRGVDAMDTPFDFGLKGEAYSDVEVVVSAVGAEVAGRVTDERDAVVGDYSLVVFSTSRDKWYRNSQYLKFARPDQDGAFRVQGLPPGDYWVAAVDAIDAVPGNREWQNPDVLGPLSLRARRLTLGEGQRASETLRLIRR